MKYILSPDSFKGSISSIKACNVMADAIHSLDSQAMVVKFPMSDGGEGFCEVMKYHQPELTEITVEVLTPDNKTTTATYLVNNMTLECYIESAQAVGLMKRTVLKYAVSQLTSYGLGQIILDALRRGYQTIYVSLGGSGINDGGIGCLNAMGVTFNDIHGKPVEPSLTTIDTVHSMNTFALKSYIENVTFRCITDVQNPLLGRNGATYVYGPQKGASEEECDFIEKRLNMYHKIVESTVGIDYSTHPGSGAAGGLGYMFNALFGAKQISGVEFIINRYRLDTVCNDADFIITGEGKFDSQSYFGKVVGSLSEWAKERSIDVICIAGTVVDHDVVKAYEHGIKAAFSISSGPMNLDECIHNCETLLYKQTQNIISLLR